jgi:mercuric ion transport protein
MTRTAAAPPVRARITAALAALVCVVGCAAPYLIGVGLLTTAGAALVERTMIAAGLGLGTAAVGIWWLHHRRKRS